MNIIRNLATVQYKQCLAPSLVGSIQLLNGLIDSVGQHDILLPQLNNGLVLPATWHGLGRWRFLSSLLVLDPFRNGSCKSIACSRTLAMAGHACCISLLAIMVHLPPRPLLRVFPALAAGQQTGRDKYCTPILYKIKKHVDLLFTVQLHEHSLSIRSL
jgi:hypothetical protein